MSSTSPAATFIMSSTSPAAVAALTDHIAMDQLRVSLNRQNGNQYIKISDLRDNVPYRIDKM